MRRYLPRRLVPILMYHRMGSIGRPSRSWLEPDLFEEGLDRLKRGGFAVLDLAALAERIRLGERMPRRAVALTFDDGWLDTYAAALPILVRFRVPATVFLVSGRIGLREYVGWGEIREMRSCGITFGAHTVSHPRLTEIPPEQARGEIEDSKKQLEDGLGEEVPTFCYPYGFFNRGVRDMVQAAGFRAACCNTPGGVARRRSVRPQARLGDLPDAGPRRLGGRHVGVLRFFQGAAAGGQGVPSIFPRSPGRRG